MTKEADKETIQALLYERSGYEQRLAQAKEAGDDEQAAVWKQSIADVNKSLAHLGHEAKPPAKRAETRPAKAGAKR